MTWLLGIVTKNPAVLAYIAAAAFAAGIAAGGIPAWKYQSALKDAVTAEYKSFVAQTKAMGEQAKKDALAKAAADKLNKEKSDAQYKNDLADADAVYKRLLNARAGRSYLPAATPGASHPDRACFDRTGLERTMGYLDATGAGIVKAGNDSRIGLDTGKRWAQSKDK